MVDITIFAGGVTMMEDKNPVKLFAEAIESGANAALVTIISAEGSSPRDCGAKMIVYENGSIAGTVGGGTLEALCIKEAVKAVKEGFGRKAQFSLTPGKTGMLCMGKVEVFIDVYKAELNILILGAGHVGQKVAQAASMAGIPYKVADERDEFANRERFPDVSEIILKTPDKAVKTAGPDDKTYVVIVTRGHILDKECLKNAMKTKAAYIGMIGSSSKVPVIFKNLNKKGLHPEKDKRVFSPIGLNCGGKSPGAIAVSVLAEILKVHHKKDGLHMREKSRL